MLGWDEVREISNYKNIEIGAHSVSHPYFNLISNNELRNEVINSKKILEKNIKKPITHFSYPKGYTNREIIEIVRNSGYKTAMTTNFGYVNEGDNPYALNRILIHKKQSFNDFTAFLKVWHLPSKV